MEIGAAVAALGLALAPAGSGGGKRTGKPGKPPKWKKRGLAAP